MPRCRIVNPEVTTLQLADVHRRELRALEALTPTVKAKDKAKHALALAQATKNLRRAEADADWVLVKKRLNHGEQSAMFERMYMAGANGLRVNPLQQGMAKVTAYLLDWSFIGPDQKTIEIADKPVDIVNAALNAFDPDSFAEIKAAIENHEEAMYLEREQEKNDLGGVSGVPAISPSLSEPAGQSSASVN